MRYTSLVIATFLLSACLGKPPGVEVVTGFELERYLGTWYEVARLDHRFERGLSEVTATYSMREDGGVKVVNRGYDAASGEWDEAVGKAYVVSDPDIGRLKVSFFGPFYGGYNIVVLDPEYQHAMVVGPNERYLWVLARQPGLTPSVLDTLVSTARDAGFPVDELIMVTHGEASD